MNVSSKLDADGNTIPSVTESYLAWRQICQQKDRPMSPTYENGLCSLCHGWKEVPTVQYGQMWCLCEIEIRTKFLEIQHSYYRSIGNSEATIDNFEPWGSDASVDKLIETKDFLKNWIQWPNSWLTIVGVPGTGKSHLLSAIDKIFWPWSLYITSADFESKAFKLTKNSKDKEKDEPTLEDMIEVVSQAPILLFDDIGSEYGKDFILALIRRVLDFRYRRPSEYVTVVTSNIAPYDLPAWDPRAADRILDKNISKLMLLKDVKSWRRNHGDHQQPGAYRALEGLSEG